jgi:lipopolysaccharide export system protein LptA
VTLLHLSRSLTLFFLCFALLPATVAAQVDAGLNRGDGPLEIDADDGIEWRRNDKVYIARGNARAASGGLEVYGEVLTAHYRKSEAGGTEVYLLEAEGDVRIVTANEIIYGDYGRYSLDDEHMMLTGDELLLESKNGRDSILAKESIEYFDRKSLAIARGDAQAYHDDKVIRADTLYAYFKPDQGNKLQVERVEAEGNVSVSTPTDLAVGESGVYYVDKELATLAGNVKITRDENQLNGEYAEVNLATGVSKLTGGSPSSETKTRVHGLVLPTSQKKGDKQQDEGGADTESNAAQDN